MKLTLRALNITEILHGNLSSQRLEFIDGTIQKI